MHQHPHILPLVAKVFGDGSVGRAAWRRISAGLWEVETTEGETTTTERTRAVRR